MASRLNGSFDSNCNSYRTVHLPFFFFFLLLLLGTGLPPGLPPRFVVVAVSSVGSSPIGVKVISPAPPPMDGIDMIVLTVAVFAAVFAAISRTFLMSAKRDSNFFPSLVADDPPAAPMPSNPSTKRSGSN